MTDEEYLVFRAKEAQNYDDCEAKAWLMTAGTLFPTNFMIQFEAYSMHKQNGNTIEAARTLEIMFRTFPCEETLWQEVRLILEHLRLDSIDSNGKFLKDLYYSLMPDVQRGLLSSAAERTSDTVEHCRLIILLLQMFPECTAQEGLKLVDTLLIAEQRSNVTNPVNSMRTLLVREILPVVLRSPTVDIPHNILFRLLHKSIEFCVYSVVKPYGLQDEKTVEACGLRDKSLASETPWHNLSVILEVVGLKLGWDLRHMFKSYDYESQWRVLHNMCCQRQIALEDPTSPLYLQIFYCGVALFLRALCEYISLIDPTLRTNGDEESSAAPVIILLEGLRSFPQHPIERPKSKKQKFENEGKDDPNFSVSSNVSVAPSVLIQCFYTATRCWDLLHASERIATDFASLCNQLGIDAWFSFQSFQIDILVYKGLHNEAIQWISTLNISNQPSFQEKLPLQAACCYYQIDEYVTACSKTMDIVCFLYEKCPKMTNDVNAITQFIKPTRHLVFVTNTMADVLSFCIKLLITHLKDIALHPGLCNDTLLGHLLVLLQYDLVEEEDMFLKIVCHIKQRGGLTYSCFFDYITNIDILEEIAYLSSTGNLAFNLLPNSTLQNTKQRAVTRGINKGAKEELRSAIEKQVSRCDEPLQPILVQFLIEKRSTLFQNVHMVPM